MHQRTFGENVGMEPVVPCTWHRDDIVECSDGTRLPHVDAVEDCRGGFHSNLEDMNEANVEIVTEVLDSIVQWAEEYCTENTDYADGYYCILEESSYNWTDIVEDWIYNSYPDDCRFSTYVLKDLVAQVIENIDAGFDCEVEYNSSEYSRYTGNGCCLDGFDIGEYEEQVDITCFDELKELHLRGELDNCLDCYNGDGYVSRQQRREKNEKTGHYENVGRETYDPYDRGDTTFEMYMNPGGRWDFVVPADRMEELVTESIIQLCQQS